MEIEKIGTKYGNQIEMFPKNMKNWYLGFIGHVKFRLTENKDARSK